MKITRPLRLMVYDRTCTGRGLLPGLTHSWRIHEQALSWFRTCETFGAEIGQRFAKAWANFFNCRVAGHTYIIGPFQSGLHILKPGEEPNWSPWEGLKDGTPATPRRALWSRPSAPNTITCLHGRIP